MLRIHFTDADLMRTRIAAAPDPLWEICMSLHRLQTRQGRWAHADWYRTTRTRLQAKGFGRTVRTFLLPLVPRAVYFPAFLTPAEAAEGLDAGLEAVRSTSGRRVRHEVGILDRTSGAPAWARRLHEPDLREELVRALRTYHDLALAPHGDRIQARIDAERATRARSVLSTGAEGILQNLGPALRWRPPVLCADYPENRDLHLGGRGLLLIPSHFCWGTPVAFHSATLDPVLLYPLHHEPHRSELPEDLDSGAPLAALLGRTRACVLRAVAVGATTGELARAAGVSASSASQHAAALRRAGLLTTHRHATSVLHTLTPLGATLLRANPPTSG
ncbi:helix-turn-helix domain-containing protein [Streptomyces sp. CC208A]|uniref:helix-turn-helix domain-containing protein n=1 Tax=Streptomyces sp. CC208A TaxID=3044573 RepID=UPI0024A7B7AC|nr:helix-turn-helix domain-containing protein [Streptomyces sp. CC208A]